MQLGRFHRAGDIPRARMARYSCLSHGLRSHPHSSGRPRRGVCRRASGRPSSRSTSACSAPLRRHGAPRQGRDPRTVVDPGRRGHARGSTAPCSAPCTPTWLRRCRCRRGRAARWPGWPSTSGLWPLARLVPIACTRRATSSRPSPAIARALAQATWRHLLFGVVLGELERRLNRPEERGAAAATRTSCPPTATDARACRGPRDGD